LNIHRKSVSEIHLFIAISWNLCARSDTTVNLHAAHLDWDGDCLKIGIAKSKRNYQDCGWHYHVFLNPLNPIICPVLSLAIHLACYRDIGSADGKPLFHESRSENCGISFLFKKLVSSLDLSGIGTHSVRKGALTFAASGFRWMPFGRFRK
jgi:hypothetical protein